MVVRNLHIERVAFVPPEADPPLLVDADAVLPLPITRQGFQPIPRRDPQFGEVYRRVEKPELPKSHTVDALWEAP
jgi:hypothetical protein